MPAHAHMHTHTSTNTNTRARMREACNWLVYLTCVQRAPSWPWMCWQLKMRSSDGPRSLCTWM